MPKINILPKNIAELIAAGEVVERPASVVKELTENSIDAGATTITVEIKNGGISYIRITDNGCGIFNEDVPKAFISHATSKVSTASDLDSIFTLGFRGEALASIAVVSKTELFTKSPEEETGMHYIIEGGEEICLENAGCPNGTTIVVRDLFYNTPARMKFLKKDVSEANAVFDVIEKLAVSHPEISFRFIRDGKQTLLTPGDNKLFSAIFAVYGKPFSETLIKVDYELNGISVRGYVCKPFNSRPTRAMQIFFLNGRYIKSGACTASLENAYKNSVMVGRYPACVLNITVPLHLVDVNVHPAKTQVRFSDETKIYSAVYYAVVSAINNFDTRPKFDVAKVAQRAADNATQLHMTQAEHKPAYPTEKQKQDFWQKVPASSFSPVQRVEAPAVSNPFKDDNDEPDLVSGSFKSIKKEALSKTEETAQNVNSYPSVEQQETVFEEPESKVVITEEEAPKPVRVIGEAFKTYIICEQGEKLYLIDKHAAHERIIFNRLKARDMTASTQLLLTPVTVSLSKNEYSVVIQNLDAFKKSGFEVEDFGKDTIIVRECPMMIDPADTHDIVAEIAENLLSGKTDTSSDMIDMMLHTSACKAAIKAGNKNSIFELEKLANEVIQRDDVRYCPHGRPVLIEITRYDLEKQFGRIQ